MFTKQTYAIIIKSPKPALRATKVHPRAGLCLAQKQHVHGVMKDRGLYFPNSSAAFIPGLGKATSMALWNKPIVSSLLPTPPHLSPTPALTPLLFQPANSYHKACWDLSIWLQRIQFNSSKKLFQRLTLCQELWWVLRTRREVPGFGGPRWERQAGFRDDWSGVQTLQSIKVKSTGPEARRKSEGLH